MEGSATEEKGSPNGLTKRSSTVSFTKQIHTNGREHQGSVTSFRNSSTAPLYSSKELLKQGLVEKYTSCRWMVTFSCFIIVTCSIMLRQCMSMAVVCMESNYNAATNFVDMGNYSNVTRNLTTQRGLWDIVWDSEMEGLILQSYFYTFPITPLIGGYLSGKFSGKMVVIVMTLCLVTLSAVTPIAATVSPYIVVVLRCLIGLSSGGLQPSITAILSKWAPLSERAQIVAVANAGLMIGSIFTFSVSGLLCTIPIHNGWPFIFYVFCILNVFSLLLWVCIVYDRPDDHPRITWKERALINYKRRYSTLEKMPSPPWLKILTSGPFWGLLMAHMSHGFLFTTIGTFLPLYMSDVLKFDIATNGLLSSLPFIGRFIGAIGSGILADNLMTKEYLSVTATRKIFHASGIVLSTPFLIWMSYMEQSERTTAVILLVTYWTVQSLNNSGFRVNHIDIAPRFAGVLNGMTATMASVAALISPIITSELTKNGTPAEWQTVFFICSGVGLAGALAFVLLGSGLEQEWAKDPNMNVDIDISVTEEKTQHFNGEGTIAVDREENDRMNEMIDTASHGGNVNKAFDEEVMEGIIGHVKLSSSFKVQSRDFVVPKRTVVESSDDKSDFKNKTRSNEVCHSRRNSDTSVFLQRTKHSRDNLRLYLPNSNNEINQLHYLDDDKHKAGELEITRL
ncbi:sialin-like [Saccostrea cucullata]|uniref:sialin-like n=1 Tax=Saccostrea cuccullata TaxID=36930 RepID=UPI002ED5ED54